MPLAKSVIHVTAASATQFSRTSLTTSVWLALFSSRPAFPSLDPFYSGICEPPPTILSRISTSPVLEFGRIGDRASGATAEQSDSTVLHRHESLYVNTDLSDFRDCRSYPLLTALHALSSPNRRPRLLSTTCALSVTLSLASWPLLPSTRLAREGEISTLETSRVQDGASTRLHLCGQVRLVQRQALLIR